MITEVWFWAILSFLMFAAAYHIVVWWKDKWSKFKFVFDEYAVRLSFLQRCDKYFKFFHKPIIATVAFGLFSFVTIAGYNSSMQRFSGETSTVPYEMQPVSEQQYHHESESMAEAVPYKEPEPVVAEDDLCSHPDDDHDCESHNSKVDGEGVFSPVYIQLQPTIEALEEPSEDKAGDRSTRE